MMENPEALPPGVAELVVNKPFYAEVEGQATLQLFDADSGRVQHEEKNTNFLGNINDNYIEWLNRERYFRYIPNRGASMASYWPIDGMQTHIACWTDTREESSSQRHFEGEVVAYANRGTYIGTDSKRGSLNLVESTVTNTRATWVFDWATNAGNNLPIRTLGWARLWEGTNFAMQNGAFTSLTVAGSNVPTTTNSNISGLAWDGTNWCMMNGNWHRTDNSRTPKREIYKINPQGALVGTLVYTHSLGTNAAQGLAWDGTNFWHGEVLAGSDTAGAGKLWRAPGNGGQGNLYNVPNCGPIAAVAVDMDTPGRRLFMLDPLNNKIHVTPIVGITTDPVTTQVLNIEPITAGNVWNNRAYGLGYEHPNKLWVYGASNALVQYDGSMNVLSRCTGGNIFEQSQGGLIYGSRTLSTYFGATCDNVVSGTVTSSSYTNNQFLDTPWHREMTFPGGHSTAGDLNAARSTATPLGPGTFHNGKFYAMTNDNAVRVLEPWALGTRIKLANETTKAATQTMKLTYNFTWV